MLSKDLEITLNTAFKNARDKRHEFMTVEHLLLALLDNESAVGVLKACGADLKRLQEELVEFVDSTTPLIPSSDSERETPRMPAMMAPILEPAITCGRSPFSQSALITPKWNTPRVAPPLSKSAGRP